MLNYTYNNNETTATKQVSGTNRVYSVTLNGAGQTASTTQNNRTLGFLYGNNGKLVSVTPPSSGSVINYDYDSRSMLTEEADPDRGTSNYKYNSLGELTHVETAKGDNDSIIYDFTGRDSLRIRENGNTTYSYYGSGPGKGNLTQVSSQAGFKKYSYNLFGNITRACDSIPAQGAFPFTYEYDDYGRVSKMTYPGGFAITYHYNTNGYLEYIKKASDNSVIWQCKSVNEQGKIKQYSLAGDNINVTKTFDGNGYLNDIKTTANSINKQWIEYSFDANTGDLNWRKDKIRNLTEDFGYDVFDQLKYSKVTSQDSLIMEYNDIGNITSKSDVGDYFYNSSRVHAVDSINGSQNLNRQNIGYNHFNKPVFIASVSDSLVYTYNVLDERIKAVHYDSLDQVIKTTWYAGTYEKVVSDTVTKHYYYINSPEGPVALAIQRGTDTPVIYYLCRDNLGSITGIMNSNGDLLEEYNYDPWGRRRNPADWSYSNVAVPTYTNRGFTGHEHLDMFNLIDMNGRIYDSEIARFTSPDPIIQDPYNILNYNRYSYCLNNPLKYTDPSGYSYQKFLQEYQNSHYSEPCAEFFNNYPGGWEDIQHGSFFDLNYVINSLHNSKEGGEWSPYTGTKYYKSSEEAFVSGSITIEKYNYWGSTTPKNANSAYSAFVLLQSLPFSMASIDGIGEVYNFLDKAPKQDFSGFWGKLRFFLNGGYLDGYSYNITGKAIGLVPITGMAPTPGRLKGNINPNYWNQLERQLSKDGIKSIFNSYKSLQKRLLEHQKELPELLLPSSVEREIRTWQRDLRTIQEFLKDL